MAVDSDGTRQQSFATPVDKIHSTLELAARHDHDRVFGLASGGTDSLTAIDAWDRFHDDHGLPPVDAVVHTNTGIVFPPTQETIHKFCADRGLPFVEVRNQTPGRMVGHRLVEYGWPGESQGGPTTAGHWVEFINRKLDTWDGVYSAFDGGITFISGGRHAESDRRAAHLGDGPVDPGQSGDRKPRLTWVAPIHGLLDGDKATYVDQYDIPVTPAYDWFGFSGDCLACSFNDPRILNEIRIACPELAFVLHTMVVWVWMRIKRGDIDQPIERAVWGTPVYSDDSDTNDDGSDDNENGDDTDDDTQRPAYQRDLSWGGCASCTSSCYHDTESDGDIPSDDDADSDGGGDE